MAKNNTLLFIPTYNESENVTPILAEIKAQNLSLDILFIDDNSTDNTGKILEKLAAETKNLFVIHRSGKLGIGSAHQDGIKYAYEKGYEYLITMDCDFSHPPDYLPKFIVAIQDVDLVVGSRYMSRSSLNGWNPFRKLLTYTGHFLTATFLGIKEDASNAYRMYKLGKIPRELFDLVESRNYSFFFESLFILALNKIKIGEISVHLPKRTYGHSKMRTKDIFESLKLLAVLFYKKLFRRGKFVLVKNNHG